MSKKIRRKALSVSMAGVLLLSVITPMPFSNPLQAAPAAAVQSAIAPAQVTADWYKSYQTMDGVGAAYAYTDSVHMLQLASAGHQDTVRHLLDLTFSEQKGTGHDIVRVIIGDNGGLTTSGATAASPGFNPLTSLLADVNNPGFDIEGMPFPCVEQQDNTATRSKRRTAITTEIPTAFGRLNRSMLLERLYLCKTLYGIIPPGISRAAMTTAARPISSVSPVNSL